ncbi:unnamed protein product, partial [Eruca vesicaria subsp. sativa]|nr:unnamed protein product [Eruca vesicaria subsp. sativa]
MYDVIYPYISWGGNCVVIESDEFYRADEVEDDRIKVVMRMIEAKHDFNDHIWEFEETPEFSFGVNDKQEEADGVSEDNGVSRNDEGSKTDEDAPKNDKEDGSDEEFQTPRGTANTSSGGRKGKRRLPDRGMEKRKQKVLSTRPKGPAPFSEDMKSFVANLFQQNFSAMEERLQKHMGERFEKMHSELKYSFTDAAVEVEPSSSKPSATKPSSTNQTPSEPTSTKPSTSKPSPTKPPSTNLTPTKPTSIKPSSSKPSLTKSSSTNLTPSKPTSTKPSSSKTTSTKPSPRRFTRSISNVAGFDPSQTNKDMEPCGWWTPMSTVRKIKVEPVENKAPPPTKWTIWKRKLELSDSPMPSDGSPQSSLYWFHEESWDRFTEWSMNPTTLKIGPTAFNMTVATRVIGPEKWLGNECHNSMKASEILLKQHERRIGDMEDAIARFEAKNIECSRELRIIEAFF